MCARKGRTRHRSVHRGAANDRPAGFRERRGEIVECQRLLVVAGDQRSRMAVFPDDLIRFELPDFRGTQPQLLTHVVGGLDHGHAGRIADPAPSREIAVSGRVRVGDHRPHALDGNPKFL